MESIKELRRRTGAPIGAVKKALEEQQGDMDGAIEHLRKLGASIAAKKANREASEGLIGIAISEDKSKATIAELNSETDFVARTEQFGDLLRIISSSALDMNFSKDVDTVLSIDPEELLGVDENKQNILNAVSALGENIVLKRSACIQVKTSPGAIYGYVHGAVGARNGKIGVLVALSGENTKELGPRLAMHVAAAAPTYTTIEDVPVQVLEKEREILLQAAIAEQKPGAKEKPVSVLEKIAEGRLKKWYSTSVLSEQEMLVEPDSYTGKPRTVAAHIKAEAEGVSVVDVCRFAVGEK